MDARKLTNDELAREAHELHRIALLFGRLDSAGLEWERQVWCEIHARGI